MVFSFIHNADETSSFFDNLISFIVDKRNYGKTIFIDISKITTLTNDALMYLLAIVNNLNNRYRSRYNFSGNNPEDSAVRAQFDESGFFKYVQRKRPVMMRQNSSNIQIIYGTQYNTNVAKKTSMFVSDLADVKRHICSFVYVMMIELMSNTYKHAYNRSNSVLDPHWYCFAEYDKKDTVSFTFMDTGMGIPATVQKNFAEKIDFLGIKGDEKYVMSALDGAFRTSTKQANRGKGLPKIKSFFTEGKIQNLKIITNSADVALTDGGYCTASVVPSLIGTLYYWEIKLSNLKGEHNGN